MAGAFVTLEQAAEFEGIGYEVLKKRIQRSPSSFQTRTEAEQENGGKPRVMVAVSSLSTKARKAHKAAQKVDGRDVIIEQKTGGAPWYIDVDLNWYIENHKRAYYEAVELGKQIEAFVSYGSRERTAHADETAARLGMSQRTLYRYAESYLEAGAWALKLEKEEGRSYDYFKVLSLCRKPRESQTFPSVTPEMRAIIENIWFDKRFSENLGTIEMVYWKLQQIAGKKGWESVPSYPTIARYISYIMEERGSRSAKFLAANGTREWKNKQMLKGKRDATALAVMEFVQGDATIRWGAATSWRRSRRRSGSRRATAPGGRH